MRRIQVGERDSPVSGWTITITIITQWGNNSMHAKNTITRVHCLFGANRSFRSGDSTLTRGEGTKKRGWLINWWSGMYIIRNIYGVVELFSVSYFCLLYN